MERVDEKLDLMISWLFRNRVVDHSLQPQPIVLTKSHYRFGFFCKVITWDKPALTIAIYTILAVTLLFVKKTNPFSVFFIIFAILFCMDYFDIIYRYKTEAEEYQPLHDDIQNRCTKMWAYLVEFQKEHPIPFTVLACLMYYIFIYQGYGIMLIFTGLVLAPNFMFWKTLFWNTDNVADEEEDLIPFIPVDEPENYSTHSTILESELEYNPVLYNNLEDVQLEMPHYMKDSDDKVFDSFIKEPSEYSAESSTTDSDASFGDDPNECSTRDLAKPQDIFRDSDSNSSNTNKSSEDSDFEFVDHDEAVE